MEKLTLIAIVIILAGCNQSAPVGTDAEQCIDNYDIGYDNAVSDMVAESDAIVVAWTTDTAYLHKQLDDIRSVLAGVIVERDNFKSLLWEEQEEYMVLKNSCDASGE